MEKFYTVKISQSKALEVANVIINGVYKLRSKKLKKLRKECKEALEKSNKDKVFRKAVITETLIDETMNTGYWAEEKNMILNVLSQKYMDIGKSLLSAANFASECDLITIDNRVIEAYDAFK